jgi:hypothetical protein
MTEGFTFTGQLYDGETCSIKRDGFTVTATIHHDSDHGAPWDEEDGHGDVTGWRGYGYNQFPTKAPGERVLVRDRRSARFYDFAGAVRKAKAEGWDAPPFGEGTPGQRAVRAAEADFQHLRAWANDEWYYVGVAVTVSRDDVELVGRYDHAVWGFESTFPDSINETAAELAEDALDAAREQISRLIAA